MKLPLPKDFFQCPTLSDKDKACLRQVGREASLDMVQLTQDPNAVTWQPVSFSNRNVRIFRGHDRTKPPSTITWCGITQLQATIEEYQDYCRMFSKDLLDGATLYTLTQPTAAFPRHYIGVKWHVAETAFVIRNRDFVNVEAQFDVEFEGRRGWVRVMRSVQLTCCPDFESLLGLVRAWHYCSGHLFLETDRPGYLAHTQLLQGTLNGNARGFVAVGAMKIIQVDDHFEVASVVSGIVRPIILSGAMLVGPRSSERDFALDKASAHRVLICDCDRDGKTVPCIEEEDVVDGGAMANSILTTGMDPQLLAVSSSSGVPRPVC
ncbi:hypothetical protein AeMF1_021367 [Aphanomyces euteiches]|nr:hypothetical protein AeMF1_021367 [Aphanomyces euteiches]KAH9190266.1 hypothetical protein AeNC1_007758 [Aphanomyces euteiches]